MRLWIRKSSSLIKRRLREKNKRKKLNYLKVWVRLEYSTKNFYGIGEVAQRLCVNSKE